MQSSRREHSTARSSSRTRPMTQDEQPPKKIDRKQAFGQSMGSSEVKDIQHGSVLREKVPDVHSELAWAGEQPVEEDDIDHYYNLTKSPYNPMGNYLALNRKQHQLSGTNQLFMILC